MLRGATYRTSKSKTTIDYSMASQCLCNKLHPFVLGEFPLKPHSPMRLTGKVGELEWVPVLDMPYRIPTELPFGPSQEALDWTALGDWVEAAHQYVANYRGSQWEHVQVLDQVYGEFVDAFEAQLYLRTDTPRRRHSTGGRPLRIRWVESSRRAERQLKSWRT